jgi:hypothetical protein
VASEFDSMLGDALDVINDVFGRPLTLTRGATVVSFAGDIRHTARDDTVQPSDLPIEGSRITLSITRAAIAPLAKAEQGDLITEEDGSCWQVAKVDRETQLSDLCHLIEPEEAEA